MAQHHLTQIETRHYFGGVTVYFDPKGYNINVQKAARRRGFHEDPHPARSLIDAVGAETKNHSRSHIRVDATRIAVGMIDIARVAPILNQTNRQVEQYMDSLADQVKKILANYELDIADLVS